MMSKLLTRLAPHSMLWGRYGRPPSEDAVYLDPAAILEVS